MKLTFQEIFEIVVSECRNSCTHPADAHYYIQTHYGDRVDFNELTTFLNVLNFAAIREEYPTAGVPEPKFAIGTVVKIVESDYAYTTYRAWPDIKYVPYFEYGDVPCDGDVHTITHVGSHEDSFENLYVLDGRFIVCDTAFEPV